MQCRVDDHQSQCECRLWLCDIENIKWRDLTGPEKKTFFEKINIPTLFPVLQQNQQIQKLWEDLFMLIRSLSKSECDADNFEKHAKEWVQLFTSVYQLGFLLLLSTTENESYMTHSGMLSYLLYWLDQGC